VRGVRSFDAAVSAAHASRALLGEHRATGRIEACALALSRGAHTFHHREKRDAYAQARVHAAEAAALLYLEGTPEAAAIGAAIEAEVLPSLGGLIRRHERTRRP